MHCVLRHPLRFQTFSMKHSIMSTDVSLIFAKNQTEKSIPVVQWSLPSFAPRTIVAGSLSSTPHHSLPKIAEAIRVHPTRTVGSLVKKQVLRLPPSQRNQKAHHRAIGLLAHLRISVALALPHHPALLHLPPHQPLLLSPHQFLVDAFFIPPMPATLGECFVVPARLCV